MPHRRREDEEDEFRILSRERTTPVPGAQPESQRNPLPSLTSLAIARGRSGDQDFGEFDPFVGVETGSIQGTAPTLGTERQGLGFNPLILAGLGLQDAVRALRGQPTQNSVLQYVLSQEGRRIQEGQLGVAKRGVAVKEKQVGLEEQRVGLARGEAERQARKDSLAELVAISQFVRPGMKPEVLEGLKQRATAAGLGELAEVILDPVTPGEIRQLIQGLSDFGGTPHDDALLENIATRANLMIRAEGRAALPKVADMARKEADLFAQRQGPNLIRQAIQNQGKGATFDSVMTGVRTLSPYAADYILGNREKFDDLFQGAGIQTPKGKAEIAQAAAKKEALIPGEVKEATEKQKALLPGQIAVAKATGLAAAEVKETTERAKPLHPFIKGLFQLPEKITVGEAQDAGIFVPDANDVQFRAIQEAARHHKNVLAAAEQIDQIVVKSPTAVGLSGRTASAVGALQAQAQNFAQLAGIPTAASLSPKDYEGTLRGLGIKEAQIQSQAIGLAYSMAVATGQRGQSVSDRDVTNMLKQIGTSVQDPVKLRQVLSDLQERSTRQFSDFSKTVFGRAPEEGVVQAPITRVPTVAEVRVMSITELRQLRGQLARFPKNVRDALEERLKVLVP